MNLIVCEEEKEEEKTRQKPIRSAVFVECRPQEAYEKQKIHEPKTAKYQVLFLVLKRSRKTLPAMLCV